MSGEVENRTCRVQHLRRIHAWATATVTVSATLLRVSNRHQTRYSTVKHQRASSLEERQSSLIRPGSADVDTSTGITMVEINTTAALRDAVMGAKSTVADRKNCTAHRHLTTESTMKRCLAGGQGEFEQGQSSDQPRRGAQRNEPRGPTKTRGEITDEMISSAQMMEAAPPIPASTESARRMTRALVPIVTILLAKSRTGVSVANKGDWDGRRPICIRFVCIEFGK